jgi:signal transduction histidine kinase
MGVPMTQPYDELVADLKRANTELRQERDAALAREIALSEMLALRNDEYGERIQQQAAAIDVLRAMAASPGDPNPAFALMTRHARELCNCQSVGIFEYDGSLVHMRTYEGTIPADKIAEYQAMFPMAPDRQSIACRTILDGSTIHVRDVAVEPGLFPVVQQLGIRTILSMPLICAGRVVGAFNLNSSAVDGFSDSQLELMRTFAEQAIIAITTADTYRTLTERTGALTRSVSELQALEEVLRAVNSSLDLQTVLSTIIARAVLLSEADEGMIYEYDETGEVFVPRSAFGMSEERIAGLRDARIRLGETYLGRSALERVPVAIADVQHEPSLARAGGFLEGIHAVLAVPLLKEDRVVGGLVIRRRAEGAFRPTTVTLMQTFAAQCVLAIENARLFQEAGRAREAAESALVRLRNAQDRLVQTEKLASLGQLTAGIAHEIKNPLNFINNFAELSIDLFGELYDAVQGRLLDEIDQLTATLKGNLVKIAEHGRRADSIVKNMLLHSRSGSGEQRPVDVNALAEEALNLAYHGARAETPGFNVTIEKDLDSQAGCADLFPQELTRVLVNMIGNGFYAIRKRAEQSGDDGFEPALRLSTHDLGAQVEVRIRDNGTGIPDAVRSRIFEPFFTTKPAGEGTGLGLSLSHDIVVKQHGGTIAVDSKVNSFTELTIILPRHAPANDSGRTA